MTLQMNDAPEWECPDCYAENAESQGQCWSCGAER